MKIGIVSDCLGNQSLEELLQTCQTLGIEQVELGCGNWSSAPHVDLDGLLESETKRDEMKGMLKDYGISIYYTIYLILMDSLRKNLIF